MSPSQNASQQEQIVAKKLLDLFGEDAVRSSLGSAIQSSPQAAQNVKRFVDSVPETLSSGNREALREQVETIAAFLSEGPATAALFSRMTAAVCRNDESGERLERLIETWKEWPGRVDALDKFLRKMQIDDPFEAASAAHPLASVRNEPEKRSSEAVVADSTGTPLTARDYYRFHNPENPEAEIYRCGPDAAASVVGIFHPDPDLAAIYQDVEAREERSSDRIGQSFQKALLESLFSSEEIESLKGEAAKELSAGRAGERGPRDLERRRQLLEEVSALLEQTLPLRDQLEGEARSILARSSASAASLVDTNSTGQTVRWLRTEIEKPNRVVPPVADSLYFNLTHADQLQLSDSEVSLLYRAALTLQAGFSWVNARPEIADLQADAMAFRERRGFAPENGEFPEVPEFLLRQIETSSSRAVTQAEARTLLMQSEALLQFREREAKSFLERQNLSGDSHLSELALTLEEFQYLYIGDNGRPLDGTGVPRSFPQNRIGKAAELGVLSRDQLKVLQQFYSDLLLCGLTPGQLEFASEAFTAPGSPESKNASQALSKFLRIHSVLEFEHLASEAIKSGRMARDYFGGVIRSESTSAASKYSLEGIERGVPKAGPLHEQEAVVQVIPEVKGGQSSRLHAFIQEGREHGPEGGFEKLAPILPWSREVRANPRSKDLTLLEEALPELNGEDGGAFQEAFQERFRRPLQATAVTEILSGFSTLDLSRKKIPWAAIQSRFEAGLVTEEDAAAVSKVLQKAVNEIIDRQEAGISEAEQLKGNPLMRGCFLPEIPARPYLFSSEVEEFQKLGRCLPAVQEKFERFLEQAEGADSSAILEALLSGDHVVYHGGIDRFEQRRRGSDETFFRPQFSLSEPRQLLYDPALKDAPLQESQTLRPLNPETMACFVNEIRRNTPHDLSDTVPQQEYFRLDLLGRDFLEALLLFTTREGTEELRGEKFEVDQSKGDEEKRVSQTMVVQPSRETWGVGTDLKHMLAGEKDPNRPSYGRRQPATLSHCWVDYKVVEAVQLFRSRTS